MFYSNTLNLIQVGGGTQVKQGDLGSKFSYKLANEKDQELDVFDKEVAHINLVLDDKIVFTTTATVDNSTVTFNIDKAIPVGLYFLEIKIRDYIFPSDKQTIIFVQSGAVAYDLKELVPNYDVNMTLKGILSDLSQKGIDISDLKRRIGNVNAELTAQLAEKVNKDELTYVTPEMFGAVGDGVTDDTKALSDMFKAVKESLRKIVLGKNKTYILRSGLEIGKICILDGNNSTILIDRIDDFTNLGNYRNQLFIDNGYNGEIDIFDWKNLNMILTPQLITNGLVNGTNDKTIRQYMIFGFGNCKEFHMDNCKIQLAGDEKNQIVLFKFWGNGKIFINNCNFRVEHRGIYGSVIWIQSSRKGDKYYARIKDSYLYDTCKDELISIFSPFGNDVVVENCTLEKRFYPSYYTETNNNELVDYTHFMIVDSHAEDSNTLIGIDDHITTFKNCNIMCKPIDEKQEKSSMFFIGGGNSNKTRDFIIFENCNIELQKIPSLGYGGDNKKATSAMELEELSNLIFNFCNIKIDDITGEYGLFYPRFWNTRFSNCFISCQKLLYDSFWQDSKGSAPYTLYMNGNRIHVRDYIGSNPLILLNKLAKNNFCLVDNEIIVTDSDNNLVSSILQEYVADSQTNGYTSDSVLFYDTSKYRFYSKGNRMNYKSLETIEINEGQTT